jgi:hypothetical protein
MADRKTDRLTEAAEKTTAVLQGLQSRLSREAGIRTPPPEIPDELGKQLEEYFASASPSSAPPHHTSARLDAIRERVIEGVVEGILRSWQEPGGSLSPDFKDALVERLIERVLDSLRSQKD